MIIAVKILGLLLIVSSAGFLVWWTWMKKNKTMIAPCIIIIVVGFLLYISDQIIEFKVPIFGTVKTTLRQAQNDAQTIDSLKNRIQNQSATIDFVAQKARNSEVQLDILDSTIYLANNQIDMISELSNFVLMVTAAQNDNRDAFDSLRILAVDPNYSYNIFALQAYTFIKDNHNGLSPFEYDKYIPWDTIADPSKLTIDDLKEFYKTIFDSFKPSFIKYVWERNDVSKLDKLDFLISIIENDPSIRAVEHAGKYFSDESKQHYKPLATYRFTDWWKENREKYLK